MSKEGPQDEMITISSARFGPISVPKNTLIQFPSGLPGFPDHRSWVLLEYKPPFSWLHSVDDQNVAFVVVNGGQFGAAYPWRAPIGDERINLKEDDEFAVLLIVTVPADAKYSTLNIKAPLFVNIRNRKGVQIIFDDSRLSAREPFWDAMQKAQAAAGQAAEGDESPGGEPKEEHGEARGEGAGKKPSDAPRKGKG